MNDILTEGGGFGMKMTWLCTKLGIYIYIYMDDMMRDIDGGRWIWYENGYIYMGHAFSAQISFSISCL